MTCNCKLWSSVGRKLLTGITGIVLVVFLIGHLVGNLTLFAGPDVFNAYAHFLATAMHGAFIYLAEAGLLVFFTTHIVSAVKVQTGSRKARTQKYVVTGNAGGASRKTLSSLNMIWSGLVVLAFVVMHICHFKYGKMAEYTLHGEKLKDVYYLVVTEFKHLPQVAIYVAAMWVLGTHLKHGVWSMFQSLGASRPNTVKGLQCAGTAFGMALALGFLVLPILVYLFFTVPTPVTGGHP
ncbi:MAG: succinate dehydrogenase cytochrome b subunit [Kiritimatiellia bacterium]